MSLAWGSLLLLIVLLPGVLFFVGTYIPEKFTRDAADRSAIGQLAGILLVSLVVHSALFVISPLYCAFLPCVDVDLLLRALTLDRAEPALATRLANNISDQRIWIALYIVVTAGTGALLGWMTGRFVVRGRLAFLVQHRWAYKLSIDKLTTAWVMTQVREGPRVLMYRGFLRYFHLKRDGTFSYIVLENVRRGYLELTEQGPKASNGGNWPIMGQSLRAQEQQALVARGQRYEETLFAIEGEDIANIVFDRYDVGFDIRISGTEFLRVARAALKDWESLASTRDTGEDPREDL